MGKKTRVESRREQLKRAGNVSFVQTIKPYLSLKHPIIRFCLLFLLLLVSFTVLLSFYPFKYFFHYSLCVSIASQAAWILQTLGIIVYASSVIISGKGFSVQIAANCTAIFEIVLFLSAVIAFPALLREKLIGGVLGTIFIYSLNLLRIVVLFLIGMYFTQFFDETHTYVAQCIFIVMVAILWLFWVGKCVKVTLVS